LKASLKHDLGFNNYTDLKFSSKYRDENLNLELALEHDLAFASYSDLAFSSNYKDENWEIKSALKYDLKNSILEEWDNNLIYELEPEWYLELLSSYDYSDQQLDEFQIRLKKNFHCRQLWFTYDHPQQKFMVEYQINLFPDKGVKLGRSQESGFIFDFGVEDILKGD
jgi:hypothetical protein